MAKRQLPSQDGLRQLLNYDPETGKLFWKERGPEWFSSGRLSAEKTAAWWNKRFSGKEAFTAIDAHGYHSGGIFRAIYAAHRIAWIHVHGSISGEIDHINGDKADNRLCNLRDVTRVTNMRNKPQNSNNVTGVVGVFWHSASGKWAAKIGVGMKSLHLGVFPTFEEAVAARKDAEREYGFHKNHGRSS